MITAAASRRVASQANIRAGPAALRAARPASPVCRSPATPGTALTASVASGMDASAPPPPLRCRASTNSRSTAARPAPERASSRAVAARARGKDEAEHRQREHRHRRVGLMTEYSARVFASIGPILSRTPTTHGRGATTPLPRAADRRRSRPPPVGQRHPASPVVIGLGPAHRSRRPSRHEGAG